MNGRENGLPKGEPSSSKANCARGVVQTKNLNFIT